MWWVKQTNNKTKKKLKLYKLPRSYIDDDDMVSLRWLVSLLLVNATNRQSLFIVSSRWIAKMIYATTITKSK